MPWFPLHNHSHFSLLDGLSKPEQIAERMVECGYAGCALTDHGSIAGVPPFIKAMSDVCKCGHQKKVHYNGEECSKRGCACQKFEKNKLKAIAGCEFYLCKQHSSVRDKSNASLSHLCVLAKGQQGWKNLIQATSESNRPENFYRKPRLSLEQLASFSKGEFIVFSGHMGSDLADACFAEPKLAYNAKTYEEAKALVRKDWEQSVTETIRKYQALFGVENFYVEIQLVDQKNLPAALVVARILRHVAKKLGVPRVATADSHYPRREDAADQRIQLCAAMETTLKQVQTKIENGEDVGLGAFFKSNNYHIPSPAEIEELHQDELEELANAVAIAARCETPSISSAPLLPVFDCPGGMTPDQYLTHLCEVGWKKKILPIIKQHSEKEGDYKKALEKEHVVLTGAGLSSYFLIVADYIRHARHTLRCRIGKGRGSAAGCLVSYLLDITRVDPIRAGLLFERFYNAGRNSPGRIALPDIDTDFPVGFRDLVFQYCAAKYGENRVCQMATFSRMQGRGALKDVLRAHERCGYEEMNRITEHIPDESEISDALQEMIEETGEASIIQWALENHGEALKEWCFINEEGDLDGPLALDFAQAIRLEGTKRSQGKHASGVIISSEVLTDIFPMVYDKSSGRMMVGVDMRDVEEMGGVKFDLLVLRTLNCVMDAEHVIRTGRLPAA